MKTAVARKDTIVQDIVDGIYKALDRRREAITFIRGEVRFLNDHEIDTGEGRLSFEKAIIATGARNVVPPSIDGIEDVEYLNNRTALFLDKLPANLVIIGGAYIGIEFAQMYGRYGAGVTLLGRNRQLAPGEDEELADLLADYLREEGIAVHTNTPVVSVRDEGSEKIVTAQNNGKETAFRAEAVLLAAGRVANTDTLGLAEAGISDNEGGFIFGSVCTWINRFSQ